MGAWSELDTEVEVVFNKKNIDSAISSLGDDELFEDVTDYLKKIRTAFDTGSKQAVEDISKRNKSFQQQIISEVCNNPSGMLSSSIKIEKKSEYTYLIGTIINHIYPMSLEKGRKGFGPIRAKALAFYAPDGGVMTFSKGSTGLTFGKAQHGLIFRKRVGPAKPRPFVAPAYRKTKSIARGIVVRKIGENLKKVK